MPLDIPLPAVLDEPAEYGTKTYRLDWENKRIIGTIDGLDALGQHCKKMLLTPRHMFPIYDDDIGSEHETLIGADVPEEYIESELPRMITDALIGDDRIVDIRDFVQEKRGDKRIVNFTIDSVYGEIEMEAGLSV